MTSSVACTNRYLSVRGRIRGGTAAIRWIKLVYPPSPLPSMIKCGTKSCWIPATRPSSPISKEGVDGKVDEVAGAEHQSVQYSSVASVTEPQGQLFVAADFADFAAAVAGAAKQSYADA